MNLCGTTRLYPNYSSTVGIPSTCLQDVVLLPLPTLLLLLVLPFLVRTRSSHSAPPPRTRTRIHTALIVLYVLLSAAVFLMIVLEIVRLALAARGIGLLPISAVGMLVTLALHYGVRRSPARVALLGYWTFMTALTALQTATLVRLSHPEPRRGTKYPAVDQITDVAVLLALYFVLFMFEVLLLPRARPPRAAHGMAPLFPAAEEQLLESNLYMPPREHEGMQAVGTAYK